MKEKGIRFPDFRFIEDEKPHWMVCLLAEKVAFEFEHLYYYRRRKGQLIQCTDKRRMLVMDVFDDLEEYLRKEKIYSFYRKEFLERKYRHYFGAFLFLDVQYLEEFFKKIRISLSDWFFLLTQYKPLKHRVFLVLLKSPFVGMLDILRMSYMKCKYIYQENI